MIHLVSSYSEILVVGHLLTSLWLSKLNYCLQCEHFALSSVNISAISLLIHILAYVPEKALEDGISVA